MMANESSNPYDIAQILKAFGLLENLMCVEQETTPCILGLTYMCDWDYIARRWVVDSIVPSDEFLFETYSALADAIIRWAELEKEARWISDTNTKFCAGKCKEPCCSPSYPQGDKWNPKIQS